MKILNNVHSLEAVDRVSGAQLQVSENRNLKNLKYPIWQSVSTISVNVVCCYC